MQLEHSHPVKPVVFEFLEAHFLLLLGASLILATWTYIPFISKHGVQILGSR